MYVGYFDSFYDLPQLNKHLRCHWRAYYPAKKVGAKAPIAAGKFPLILTLNLPTDCGQNLAAAGNIVCQLQFPQLSATTPNDYPQWLAEHPRLVAANKQAVKQSLLVIEQLLSPHQINSAPLQAHIRPQQVGACGYGFGGSVALELLRRSHLIMAASGATNYLASQKWASPCEQPQLLIQSPAKPGLSPIFKRARKRAYLYTTPQLTPAKLTTLSRSFFAASFAHQPFDFAQLF